MSDAYLLDNGIDRSKATVIHRDDEYDPAGFVSLRDMQSRHFWYHGRHRFLWYAFQRFVRRMAYPSAPRIIDLGGGCGGWIRYLLDRGTDATELALGDSSLRALDYAAEVLPPEVRRYQIDLLNLEWTNRWDVAFLLDVLEHIPADEEALRQIHGALAPGGLLLITTPALNCFWTWNDDAVHHVRRYSKADYRQLAAACGYELLDVRYFMFFLSPLLLASRWLGRSGVEKMSDQERSERLARTHRVPNSLVNRTLGAIFAAETPLGHVLPFPWGTSVLAVLRKAAVDTRRCG